MKMGHWLWNGVLEKTSMSKWGFLFRASEVISSLESLNLQKLINGGNLEISMVISPIY